MEITPQNNLVIVRLDRFAGERAGSSNMAKTLNRRGYSENFGRSGMKGTCSIFAEVQPFAGSNRLNLSWFFLIRGKRKRRIMRILVLIDAVRPR